MKKQNTRAVVTGARLRAAKVFAAVTKAPVYQNQAAQEAAHRAELRAKLRQLKSNAI